MKTYAVAFINFFDNELIIKFIQAEDITKAVLNSGWLEGWELYSQDDVPNGQYADEDSTLHAMKRFAWECDAMIDVKQVPEVVKTIVRGNPAID